MRRASGGPPATEGGRSPRYRLTNPLPARSQGSRTFGCWTTTVSFFFCWPVRFGPPRRSLDRPTRNAWAPTIAPFDGERIVTCGAILSGLRTVTERPVVSASPCESRISNVTAYVPAVVKTWEAVSEEDHRVSHRPSPSQSHRAWRDALGSASEEDDPSKRTEWFATATNGE